ncbi:hypothetical protein V9T40_007594 [Parthenolecanium corni]|uniref:Uncharacterized protein n=1 Tax=Parthenolecanium corni TaxID=536013 RepID=A0AAN9Y4U0_9HEMI
MALCYPNGRKKSDTKKLKSTTKCNHVLVWNQAELSTENHIDEEVARPSGLQFHYMSVEFGCSDGMKKLIKILGPVEYFEERFQRCVVKSQY